MVPEKERYIFNASLPGPAESEMPTHALPKKSKLQFTHKMLAQKPIETPGGQVRITDTTQFPLSTTVSAAHVVIKPGGIREMHWHPNADEWSFFIRGRARVTVFGSGETARTFDYMPGGE